MMMKMTLNFPDLAPTIVNHQTLNRIMDPETSFFLARISSYIMIGPCVLSLFRFKSPFQVHKQLAFVVFLGAFISIAANFFNVVLQMPNLFLLHIYTIFDFILLTLIFKDVLPQIVFKVLIFTFPLFAAVNSIFLEKLMIAKFSCRTPSVFGSALKFGQQITVKFGSKFSSL